MMTTTTTATMMLAGFRKPPPPHCTQQQGGSRRSSPFLCSPRSPTQPIGHCDSVVALTTKTATALTKRFFCFAFLRSFDSLTHLFFHFIEIWIFTLEQKFLASICITSTSSYLCSCSCFRKTLFFVSVINFFLLFGPSSRKRVSSLAGIAQRGSDNSSKKRSSKGHARSH